MCLIGLQILLNAMVLKGNEINILMSSHSKPIQSLQYKYYNTIIIMIIKENKTKTKERRRKDKNTLKHSHY